MTPPCCLILRNRLASVSIHQWETSLQAASIPHVISCGYACLRD